MRRACWVALVVLVVAAVTGSVLYAQAGGGAPAPAEGAAAAAPAGGAARGGQMALTPERMAALLDRLQLSAEDRAAVEKSLPVAWKARQALQEELTKLRAVADDPNATDEQLTQAVDKYMKARSDYRDATRPENRALTAKLSVRGRARCLAAGLLDNGLGFSGIRTTQRRPAAGQ